jgi:hypothetical protein
MAVSAHAESLRLTVQVSQCSSFLNVLLGTAARAEVVASFLPGDGEITSLDT